MEVGDFIGEVKFYEALNVFEKSKQKLFLEKDYMAAIFGFKRFESKLKDYKKNQNPFIDKLTLFKVEYYNILNKYFESKASQKNRDYQKAMNLISHAQNLSKAFWGRTDEYVGNNFDEGFFYNLKIINSGIEVSHSVELADKINEYYYIQHIQDSYNLLYFKIIKQEYELIGQVDGIAKKDMILFAEKGFENIYRSENVDLEVKKEALHHLISSYLIRCRKSEKIKSKLLGLFEEYKENNPLVLTIQNYETEWDNRIRIKRLVFDQVYLKSHKN